MQCVILAGGLGTRLWPETKTTPKTLLPIAGAPFATWQLSWLAQSGIDSVVYCVGHLGQLIRDHIGDGASWGLSVRYVDEGEHLRGTAGALRLAYDENARRERGEPALMTVFRNDGRWDGSNVVLDGPRVRRYAKGLTAPPPEMRWIDYGLLTFRRGVISERVPPDGPQDLAPLCAGLAEEGLLAGFEVHQRFYEIGSVAGRDELEALFTARQGAD